MEIWRLVKILLGFSAILQDSFEDFWGSFKFIGGFTAIVEDSFGDFGRFRGIQLKFWRLVKILLEFSTILESYFEDSCGFLWIVGGLMGIFQVYWRFYCDFGGFFWNFGDS